MHTLICGCRCSISTHVYYTYPLFYWIVVAAAYKYYCYICFSFDSIFAFYLYLCGSQRNSYSLTLWTCDLCHGTILTVTYSSQPHRANVAKLNVMHRLLWCAFFLFSLDFITYQCIHCIRVGLCMVIVHGLGHRVSSDCCRKYECGKQIKILSPLPLFAHIKLHLIWICAA